MFNVGTVMILISNINVRIFYLSIWLDKNSNILGNKNDSFKYYEIKNC